MLMNLPLLALTQGQILEAHVGFATRSAVSGVSCFRSTLEIHFGEMRSEVPPQNHEKSTLFSQMRKLFSKHKSISKD